VASSFREVLPVPREPALAAIDLSEVLPMPSSRR